MINFQSMKNNFHSSGYDQRRERFIQEKRICDKELLERFAYIRKLAIRQSVRLEVVKRDGGDTISSMYETQTRDTLNVFSIKNHSQYLIGCYLCDIYLPEYNYVVEVDGREHGRSRMMKNDIRKIERFSKMDIPVYSISSREPKKEILRLCRSLSTQPKLSKDEQLYNHLFMASATLCLLSDDVSLRAA